MQKYPEIHPGDKFGSWTVLCFVGKAEYGNHLVYRCRCDCGLERNVLRNSLVRGLSKSCGTCHRNPDPWVEEEGDHYRYHCSNGDTFIFSPCDLELALSAKWHISPSGYAIRNDTGTMVHFARCAVGAKENEYVDHISCVTHDERRENLRICTWSDNNCNKILQSNNTSGFKGVSFHKASGKYLVSLWKDGVHHYGGLHSDPIDAAIAYDKIAREFHGEYARLNFPKEGERNCRETG